MAYCTLTDITAVIPPQELINLTVDEPDIDSVINEAIFDECAQASDSLINGYLRARYKLPLQNAPRFLKTIATDITAYRLYMRRPRVILECIKENYNNALKQLLSIKKGDIMLETPTEDAGMPKTKSAFRTNKTQKDRVFNNNTMRSFRQK